MTATTESDTLSAIPRLGTGMKFRHDKVRDAWVILGPERLFLPDEHAVAVLKLIDGARSVGDISAALALTYDAPADAIAADIWPMLRTLAASGAVRW
jgi:pyrroloquinoline quinone biosynthesis protein D